MRSRIPKRYFLIPILYLILIAFFIQLHLTGGGRISTEKIGPIQLWVKEAGGMGNNVETARVSLYGFTVEFNEGVEFRAPDGATRDVAIEEVITEEGNIELVLANGGALKLAHGYPVGAGMFRYPALYTPSSDYRGVAFFYDAQEAEGDELPVLPLSSERSGALEVPQRTLPITVVQNDTENVVCAGARLPQVEGSTAWFTLPADNTAADVVVSPYSGEPIRKYWLLGETQPATRDEFAKTYASYLDTAYAGWKERYRSSSGSWSRTGSVEAAEEKIAAAFGAESLRRNGTVGLDRFSAAIDGLEPESLRAAPFLDSLIELDEAERQSEASRAQALETAVEAQDPSLFAGTHDLASFLVWHGDRSLIRRVDEFAASLAEKNKLGSAAAAGLCIFYSDAAMNYPALFPAIAERGESAMSLLFPHFVRSGNALFYAGPEQMNTGIGLDLARSLIRYGENREDSFAASLGYTLATQYLGHADGEGFVPARFTASEEGFTPGEEDIAPETLYPWISDNASYPRVVSLADELDSGVRLYTVASEVGAVRNGATVTITLDYEVGETQYVMVRGLEPFSNFFFYGQRWSSDRRFQTYGVGGWYYNEQRQSLYMKLRHQQQVEQIMFDQQ